MMAGACIVPWRVPGEPTAASQRLPAGSPRPQGLGTDIMIAGFVIYALGARFRRTKLVKEADALNPERRISKAQELKAHVLKIKPYCTFALLIGTLVVVASIGHNIYTGRELPPIFKRLGVLISVAATASYLFLSQQYIALKALMPKVTSAEPPSHESADASLPHP